MKKGRQTHAIKFRLRWDPFAIHEHAYYDVIKFNPQTEWLASTHHRKNHVMRPYETVFLRTFLYQYKVRLINSGIPLTHGDKLVLMSMTRESEVLLNSLAGN